ncbi:hypothetical protein [Saccharicrinis fermentans]|uniref:Uncharacterized protein n=1 Tax=Saccharicrinis fermentans DSM 9555 = JCM 21142 TaxID=869213 RepID=W7Y7A3_9BACT|nr:hypothetical protein [Saccharicrinis fermentans]GAF04127.1 hypothetical protein JCM21142_72822 [Saccharicrinis fermentans DSM 9555 = JCM 21142]
MWRYFILVIFLTTQSGIYTTAQIRTEVKLSMDSLPDKLPSIGNLAAHIHHRFSNQEDMTAAIYYWIAKNIAFDSKEHFAKKKKFTYNFRYKTQDEKKTEDTKDKHGIGRGSLQT